MPSANSSCPFLDATEANAPVSQRCDALFREELRSNRLAINQWSIDEASRVDHVPFFQLASSPLGPLAGGWGPMLRDNESIKGRREECKQQWYFSLL